MIEPSHAATLRLIRIANGAVLPFYWVWSNLQILVPFIISGMGTWIALDKLDSMDRLFPVYETKVSVILVTAFLVGLASAFPAYRQNRARQNLLGIVRQEYARYVVVKLEEILDQEVETLKRRFSGQLTMSIMVPQGHQPLHRSHSLKIVAASDKIRRLPSVYLELDWDEGVAGRVWRQGLGASALPVRVPESFSDLGINEPPRKRQAGNFDHKSGVCFPIASSYRGQTEARFLGVLCLGSRVKEDYDLFSSYELIQEVFTFIDERIRDGVALLNV